MASRLICRLSVGIWFNTEEGIARQFNTEHRKDLSIHSQCLRQLGLKAQSAVAKLLINRKNRRARLNFAEKCVVWTEENWPNVRFSNDSKFNLFESDRKQYVCC